MKAAIIVTAMAIFAGCTSAPEGKRVEIAPALGMHQPMLCRRSTVKIDGQYEVVMICRPVDKVPPDAHEQVPKHKI